MTEHRLVELVGGPRDGHQLDVTGWTEQQLRDGVALIAEHGAYGAGGRACYAPPAGDPHADRWPHEGDLP
jgi:hypothetical protein